MELLAQVVQAVIDQHGKTLSAPSDESLAGKMAQDRKSEVEARIAKTVKDMIWSLFASSLLTNWFQHG